MLPYMLLFLLQQWGTMWIGQGSPISMYLGRSESLSDHASCYIWCVGKTYQSGDFLLEIGHARSHVEFT